MSSWARVGMKVVCVKEGALPISSTVAPPWTPSLGCIYTIEQIDFINGHLALTLEGQPDKRWGFFVGRFRPLITKSQEDDISMFKSLLKPNEVMA